MLLLTTSWHLSNPHDSEDLSSVSYIPTRNIYFPRPASKNIFIVSLYSWLTSSKCYRTVNYLASCDGVNNPRGQSTALQFGNRHVTSASPISTPADLSQLALCQPQQPNSWSRSHNTVTQSHKQR